MSKIISLEATLHEYANLVTLTDILTREINRADDGRLWLDEHVTKELRQRTAAAVKTLMQEDPE